MADFTVPPPELPVERMDHINEADLLQKFMELPTGLADDEEEEAQPAADHPETESDEGEVTQEAEASDEGEPESDQPVAETVKVQLDGVGEITLDELKKGYLREQDYTRKTQAVAAERQKVESEVLAKRDEYAAGVDHVHEILSAIEPRMPDPALRETNPNAYLLAMEDYRAFQAEKQQVAAEKARLDGERAAEWEQKALAHRQAEGERLRARIPTWDEKEAPACADYLRSSYNATNDDLMGLTDHRMLEIVNKARLWDEMQTRGKEQIEAKKVTAKVIQPGSRDHTVRTPGAREEARKAIQKAKKTQDKNDILAAFMALPD